MRKECFQSLTKETALGNQLLSLFPHFPGRQNTGIISSQTFQLRYAEQAPAKQASLSTKGSLLTVRQQWVSCIFNHFICLPGWRTYNRNPSRKTSECLEKWDVTSQETTKERQNVQTTTRGSAQMMSARKNRKHSEAITPGSMGKVLHTCFFNPRILWWTVMDSFLQMRKLRHNAGTNLSHLFKVTVGSGQQGCNQNTDGLHPVWLSPGSQHCYMGRALSTGKGRCQRSCWLREVPSQGLYPLPAGSAAGKLEENQNNTNLYP